MKSAIVVGGGIGGMVTAHRLHQSGKFNVRLLEREPVPGGRARSIELAPGFYGDDSAQFLANCYKHTIKMMKELKIYQHIDRVDTKRFGALLINGNIHPVPVSLTGFLKTDWLSLSDKWNLIKLIADLFFKYKRGAMRDPATLIKYDKTRLSDYILDNFPKTFAYKILDRLIEPIVQFVMAKADEVSLVSFAGLLGPVSLSPHFVLPHGIGGITESLAKNCPWIECETAIEKIVVRGKKVKGVVLKGSQEIVKADIVVCGVQAPEAASLLTDCPEIKKFFQEKVTYSSCLHVFYGLEKPYLDYWGLIIPKSAGSILTYITEETNKSSHRTPYGKGLMQAYVTGQNAIKLYPEDDDTIAGVIFSEVKKILPYFKQDALFSKVIRRENAMPLLRPGYLNDLVTLKKDVSKIKGLYLVNDYLTHSYIEAVMVLAKSTAKKIIKDTC